MKPTALALFLSLAASFAHAQDSVGKWAIRQNQSRSPETMILYVSPGIYVDPTNGQFHIDRKLLRAQPNLRKELRWGPQVFSGSSQASQEPLEQETRRASAQSQRRSYYSGGMPSSADQGPAVAPPWMSGSAAHGHAVGTPWLSGSAAQGPVMGAPNGVINPRNGQFYPGIGGGAVLNQRSGEVYPAAGPGLVINPRNGQVMPVH